MKKKKSADAKYITTNEFNKVLGEIFEERLKQVKLATTNDLILLSNALSKMGKKIGKSQTYDLSHFIDQSYFSNERPQNFLKPYKTIQNLHNVSWHYRVNGRMEI